MRFPPPRPPPCPARADAGAYRLRRVLRYRREARQSGACRQARDHRRRQARRGVGRLLRLANLWRALGDADVQGAGALPAGCRNPARHGEICPRRPRGAARHADADAAGGTAVDRRGVPRSCRHATRSRHDSGKSAGALCPRRRARHRDHGVGRPVLQQVPGQDRLRSRQAARLCRPRPDRGPRNAGGQAGRLHLWRRPRDPGEAGAAGFSHHCGPAARRRGRADEAVRRRRPPAVAAGARHRRPQRGGRTAAPRPFPTRPRSRTTSRILQRWKRCCGGCPKKCRRG